jgi:hypothetical protein
MKKLLAVLICAIFLPYISGCRNDNDTVKPAEPSVKPPEKPCLPPEVAGVWQAVNLPWKIVLTPDGRVPEAYVLWEEVVRPNQKTEFQMPDCPSYLTGGDFAVEYRPADRELSVSIELKDIHICLPIDAVVDGNSLDTFVGKVSEDGKVWEAGWISIFDWGPNFPQGPNDIEDKPVVFNKVEN